MVNPALPTARVPKLSLIMYPFSTPTDEHVPLKFLMAKYVIVIIDR